jgi:hypothetical protein
MTVKNKLSTTAISRWEVDTLPPTRALGFSFLHGNFEDLVDAYDLVRRHLKMPIAALQCAEMAIAANRDNFFVWREGEKLAGVYAMLMLNVQGLESLLLGEFNPRNLDTWLLSQENEAPAAIYKWAFAADRAGGAMVQAACMKLRDPRCAKANIYGRPMTPYGRRLCKKLGFNGLADGVTQRSVRLANRQMHSQEVAA